MRVVCIRCLRIAKRIRARFRALLTATAMQPPSATPPSSVQARLPSLSSRTMTLALIVFPVSSSLCQLFAGGNVNSRARVRTPESVDGLVSMFMYSMQSFWRVWHGLSRKRPAWSLIQPHHAHAQESAPGPITGDYDDIRRFTPLHAPRFQHSRVVYPAGTIYPGVSTGYSPYAV